MKAIPVFLALFFIFLQTCPGQINITLRPGPDEGQDCEIRTDWPNATVGYSPSFCSDAWTISGEFVIIRSLIRFDLSSIPGDAVILEASLSLYCNPASAHYQLQYGDNQSYLMRVLEHWDQDTVTWNTQPETTMDQVILLPTSTTTTQNYPDINVTEQVQDMVTNPDLNFGWMLRLVTEEELRSMEFSASNDTDESYRPLLEIVIQCDLPEAGFTYQLQPPTVLFTDQSTSAHTWHWDFGDGYYSTLQNPEHTYLEEGNYLVCLIVSDSCGSDTICDTIPVCDPMDPRFGYEQEGHFVTFSDSSYSADSWYWDFGDKNYSTEQNPVHYYEDFGTYYVCLTTTNACLSEQHCDSLTLVPDAIDESGNNRIDIYPNPVNDILKISPGEGLKIDEIVIYNLVGQEVRQEKTRDQILDVSSLPSGVYVLEVVCGERMLIGKFIK